MAICSRKSVENRSVNSNGSRVLTGLLKVVIVAYFLLALAGPAWGGSSWWGEVAEVLDGDTIVILREQTRVEVDLVEIDAPELDQPFGPKAADQLRELLKGRRVRVAPREMGQEGRIRAEVFSQDGLSLNLHLLESGHAWWDRRSAPGCGACEHSEKKARKAKRGLWALPNPIPPWEWRTGIKS